MIRSSKHTLKYTNHSKKENLCLFLTEYRRLLQESIDHLWTTPIQRLNITNNTLYCPKFLETAILNDFDTWFTARMKQCVGKQACAMVSASITKRRRQLYMLRKNRRKGKNTKALQQTINRQPLVKPDASNAKAELDSRFVDIQASNFFDEFVRVKTIGDGLTFNLPLKHTNVSNKWKGEGKRKAGIRISEDTLSLIFEIPKAKITGNEVVGADQGQITCLTMSDKQVTNKCPHGHDLTTIQETLKRKRKGTKGFRRAQSHRKNYIHWAINQLNFKNIKEVRFERVKDVRKGKPTNRKNSHWTYTAIKDKMIQLSETEGFRFIEVTNEFRSQRCSSCGWVHKANRKGKGFTCNLCGFADDADLNAALNIELTLFVLPYWVRKDGLNRTSGFYWLADGFYDIDHEPIVRGAQRAIV